MGEKNGNGFKIAFWVMTVIATVGLVGVINAVVVNDRTRQTEDKGICEKVEQGDKVNRDMFLVALKEVQADYKKDSKDFSDKLEKVATDIAVIKNEIKKK